MFGTRVLFCGASGFIGSHMVKRLKQEGCLVRDVDLKHLEFGASAADDFVNGDLRNSSTWEDVLDSRMDEA